MVGGKRMVGIGRIIDRRAGRNIDPQVPLVAQARELAEAPGLSESIGPENDIAGIYCYSTEGLVIRLGVKRNEANAVVESLTKEVLDRAFATMARREATNANATSQPFVPFVASCGERHNSEGISKRANPRRSNIFL
jgi:hypothetical protein